MKDGGESVGFGGSTSLGMDGEKTPRPLSDSKALGLSLAGGTTKILDHSWLCFDHPWTDTPPTPRQTPPRQTAHHFLGNLSHGKKNHSPE